MDDAELVELLLAPVRKCAAYKPAFGRAKGGELEHDFNGFKALYGSDPFYSWMGLDDATVYAAHRAAGGLTSVYRQLGVGCERLLRRVLGESLGLTSEQLEWSYDYAKPDGEMGTHTLDAHVRILDVADEARSGRFREWIKESLDAMGVSPQPVGIEGAVFEIRQGYKSADSKRQNADLRFGMRAYQADRLPAFAILSTQVSEPVMKRYRADGMLVLSGTLDRDPTISTFAFVDQIVGYDLAAFFERNRQVLKQQVTTVTSQLLSAD